MTNLVCQNFSMILDSKEHKTYINFFSKSFVSEYSLFLWFCNRAGLGPVTEKQVQQLWFIISRIQDSVSYDIFASPFKYIK